ncbi:MAG: gfo/Idh/MocA family oxidoreductase [Gemmatimonadetes bacterium]|nr:MAG: gfo/Idh/MocA family oxidoreductase [Gemmatimonadota bacterium]
MSDKPIKIGVIGTGAVAQIAHLPAYQRLDGVEITAICDPDQAKVQKLAEKYAVTHVFTDYTDLVKLPDLDAVDICTPNHLHAEIAISALNAGKHVLCERPLGRNAAETEQVLDASQSTGKILMVGYNNRFREDAQLLKKFMEQKELGDIFYVKTGWLRPKLSFLESWQSHRTTAGGGVFMDLGVPMLDLGRWLIGAPKVESVTAAFHSKVYQQTVEDSAVALIRFENDVTMNVEVTWGLLGDKDFHYLNVFGTHGGALLNPLRIHKEMHDSLVNLTPSIEASPGHVYKQSYEKELIYFIDHVRSGTPPMCNGEEALEVMRIVDAIYQSAKTKKTVELSES